MPRTIAVFGAGYIGLVTAACLAELGHAVVVRDIQPDRVQRLQAGEVPIFEPGLAEMIARNTERLSFTLDAATALAAAEVAYVCVDTPPTVSGDADLSRVWSVVDSLRGAPALLAVVVKSTVPVGTGKRIRTVLNESGLEHVGYASNPEFTAEGRAVADFMTPDRIVIGGSDQDAIRLVADLHHGINAPIEIMDVASAEMTKLAANAALMTRISFINEIAALCELTGADVELVSKAIGLDHRIGSHFLQAGIGWGGSCFPKDSEALKQLASNTGYHPQLLNAAIEVNNLQKRRAIQTLKQALGSLEGTEIALLGMTFKPSTDDMRESPSTVLAARLLAEGARVRCWDPLAPQELPEPWSQTTRHPRALDALDGADAVILATAWPELRELPWHDAHDLMRRPVMFDGRNLLDPAKMRALGFTYMSVGRP
ncbi:UDP-glucose dehydrogenase family protein [Nonomuraea soli]|uniref:UDP-glucose 6-dehydrogenase n=1 Tax=Nonomuraea soli TaxID=1032476 RepID=A0A7W0CE37_9ACTN|nr:UDP-glucose/GDP-mannose dehydrogenase family protein [Nonomuraea soli]MBA2889470.1 UDPglucose 6-dehydrogenase [Nonomuraea soli]